MAREAVGRDLGGFVLDWAGRADAYVQFSVSAFEYPRSDLPASVHFAGPLPAAPSTAPLPDWWSDLDGRRPVIHVSQGTIANADFGQLVLPTIAGLAATDALVVVSTGGRPVDALPAELPANVRVAEYLPYDRLLPEIDVFVTNGGFGGVQQALAQGVPLVVAGQTEDKVEVSARVGWTGVGVNLRTNAPKPGQVAAAVHRVLVEPAFRDRARQVGEAMRAADAWQTLDAVLAGRPLGPHQTARCTADCRAGKCIPAHERNRVQRPPVYHPGIATQRQSPADHGRDGRTVNAEGTSNSFRSRGGWGGRRFPRTTPTPHRTRRQFQRLSIQKTAKPITTRIGTHVPVRLRRRPCGATPAVG